MGKKGLRELQEATAFVKRIFPLPRCVHGNALKDHAGEKLYPNCGCSFDRELESLNNPRGS